MSDMGHHGGHGGHMHAGHGGDGGAFGQSITHGYQQHNGFLSHLFGLDQSHGHHPHGMHMHGAEGVSVDQSPQGSPSWSSPLQAVKLSDVFHGINVTPNILFLILFFGLFAWLFVIYWIRHHEPLASSQIGQRQRWGYASTAQADRQLVAGMRHAVPIRTSPYTGDVYLPTGPESQPSNPASSAMAASPAAVPPPASVLPGIGNPDPSPVAGPSMGPVPAFVAQSPAAAASATAPAPASGFAGQAPGMSAIAPAQLGAAMVAGPSMGAYCVPIRTADGTRVKTVTNR